MAGNDELHRLIHSLTPSEKRYFRLHVQPYNRQGASIYLQLFDAVLAQEYYDQEAILATLSQSRKVSRFSAEKNYLYQLILKVMRDYVADQDVFRKIRGMVSDLQFLFDKALYPESLKLLGKAWKLAEEFDDLPAQVELLLWERKLLKRQHNKGKKQGLEELIARKDTVLDRLHTQTRYADLYDRLFLMTQRDTHLRDAEGLDSLRKLLEESGLQEEDRADSFQSRHLYFQIFSFYHQLQGDSQAARDCQRKLIRHWEDNPSQLHENPGKYSLLLSNYLGYCQLEEDHAEFPEIIEKIKQTKGRNKREEIQSLGSAYYYELLYHLNAGDLYGGIDAIDRIEAWLPDNESMVSQSLLLGYFHNSAILMFLSGNFSQALRWVNRLLLVPETEARRDSLQAARMLQMVIHFELGDQDLVESLLRSAKRYYQKHDRLFQFEGKFLQTIRQLIRQPATEWKAACANLKAEMDKLAEKGAAWPGFVELGIWLDSRLKGKPMQILAAEHYTRRKPI